MSQATTGSAHSLSDELTDPSNEILRLQKEIDWLSKLYEEAKAAKDTFLDKTSHELKSPLSSIIGYCDLILSEDDGSIDEEGEFRLCQSWS